MEDSEQGSDVIPLGIEAIAVATGWGKGGPEIHLGGSRRDNVAAYRQGRDSE